MGAAEDGRAPTKERTSVEGWGFCSMSLRFKIPRHAIYNLKYFNSISMNRRTLIYGIIYGLCGGVLIAFLKYIEYRFIIVEHSIEIYGGLTAILFASVGIWLGLKLTRKKEVVIVKEVPVTLSEPFLVNESQVRDLGITKRELEILELIAQGLSNREIAEKLFVSENTVKTHSSRLLDKLSAKRRTQAVQIAKEMRLIK